MRPCFLALLLFAPLCWAEGFDLTRAIDAAGWIAAHDVGPIQPTAEGLAIDITGPDPYIYSPARNYPTGQLAWITVKLKSDHEGMAQIFYFDRSPTEERS